MAKVDDCHTFYVTLWLVGNYKTRFFMRSSQHARQHDATMFWFLHRFDRAVAIKLQSDMTPLIRSMWNLSKSEDRFLSYLTMSPILRLQQAPQGLHCLILLFLRKLRSLNTNVRADGKGLGLYIFLFFLLINTIKIQFIYDIQGTC